jgi:signal transduction histidine kinase
MKRICKRCLTILLFLITSLCSFGQIANIKNLWEEFNNAKHDTTRILLLINKIGYSYQSIDSDSAEMYYQMAVTIADEAVKSSDSDITKKRLLSLKATSTRYIGIVNQNTGQYNKAVNFFLRSLEIAQNIGDKMEMSRAYNNLGIVQRRLGNLDMAIEYYSQSLNLSKELNDLRGLGYAYNNIGTVLMQKGDISKALHFFENSLEIRQKLGDKKGVSHVSNNIGNLYRKQRNYPKAFLFFNKSLSIEHELNDRNGIAMVNNSLAGLNIAIADSSSTSISIQERETFLQKSINYAQKAYDISVDLKSFPRQNTSAGHLMYAYKQLGNFKKALEFSEDFITTKDSMFNQEKTKAIVEMQTKYETEKKQREIESQLLVIEKQEIEGQRQKGQRNFFILVFSLSIILVFLILYAYFQKQKNNRILTERSYEIETLNEELISTNEELQTQRDNLQDTLVKLQQTQTQLIQSEKKASIGVLAAGVAHEINNPLNYIQGGIFAIENYVMERIPEHINDISPYLEIVKTGVLKSAKIVASLSHYSRNGDFIYENCDVHSIIENCLMILNDKIDNKLTIRKEYTPTPFTYLCNEGEMHQVILNILLNAIDAIENEGTIHISTKVANNSLEVSITDSGCGISPENLSKITDPFFTTKEAGKGTGLGLSIAQEIIENHGGKLAFESELGVGTTATITLQLSNS